MFWGQSANDTQWYPLVKKGEANYNWGDSTDVQIDAVQSFKTEILQTFDGKRIDNPPERVNKIKIEVLENHGNDTYTCFYRFRVHGHPEKK